MCLVRTSYLLVIEDRTTSERQSNFLGDLPPTPAPLQETHAAEHGQEEREGGWERDRRYVTIGKIKCSLSAACRRPSHSKV